jgi:hypothetical protein
LVGDAGEHDVDVGTGGVGDENVAIELEGFKEEEVGREGVVKENVFEVGGVAKVGLSD